METRNIVSFYELTEDWQNEALSNLDDLAEETIYLEPLSGQNPKEHILFDLHECMWHSGNDDGFEFNAVIGISNNSAMLLNIDDSMETATIKFV